MKFIDLFAGLGGFHQGLSNAGGFDCVFASEIDSELRNLYTQNYSICPHGDITQIRELDIPKHDFLCAGFPCQAFSLAGSKEGSKCPKSGKLIDEIIRITKYHRAEFLLLENVPNILTIANGTFWNYVKKSFEQLGYKLIYKIISPDDVGIPQNRKRVFILGSLNHKLLDRFEWPEVSHKDKQTLNDIIDSSLAHRKLEAKKIQQLKHWQCLLNNCNVSNLPSISIIASEFGATYPLNFTAKTLGQMRRYRGAHGTKLKGCRSWKELFENLPRYTRKDKSVPDWLLKSVEYSRRLFRANRGYLSEWSKSLNKANNSWQILEWRGYYDILDLSRHILQFRASGIRVLKKKRFPSLIAMTPTQIPIIASEMRYMSKYEATKLQCLDKPLPDNDTKAFKVLGNAVNAKIVEMIAIRLKLALH